MVYSYTLTHNCNFMQFISEHSLTFSIAIISLKLNALRFNKDGRSGSASRSGSSRGGSSSVSSRSRSPRKKPRSPINMLASPKRSKKHSKTRSRSRSQSGSRRSKSPGKRSRSNKGRSPRFVESNSGRFVWFFFCSNWRRVLVGKIHSLQFSYCFLIWESVVLQMQCEFGFGLVKL